MTREAAFTIQANADGKSNGDKHTCIWLIISQTKFENNNTRGDCKCHQTMYGPNILYCNSNKLPSIYLSHNNSHKWYEKDQKKKTDRKITLKAN